MGSKVRERLLIIIIIIIIIIILIIMTKNLYSAIESGDTEALVTAQVDEELKR